MKTALLIAVLLTSFHLEGQTPSGNGGWTVKGQYSHDFVIDGYVRVREWELEGDKMKLKTLGVSNFSALKLQVTKEFRKHNSLSIFYEEFLVRGGATVNSDIEYNGTIIDGS